MESLQWLYLLSGLVVLLLIIVVVVVKRMKKLRFTVEEKWEEIDLGLRKRADMVPFLIEVFRRHDNQQNQLITNLIKVRREAILVKNATSDRIEAENILSAEINKLVDFAKLIKNLAKDVLFLEVRKNINDLEQNLELKVRSYNNMVRSYNDFLKGVFVGLLAAIFGYKKKNIFEIEI